MAQAYDTDRLQVPLTVSTQVKESGKWAKQLTVTVSAEDVTGEYEHVAGELAGAVNIPGFRRGKVPRNVVEKRFGDDIQKQVTSNLLSRGLRAAIEKEKLEMVGEPHVDVEKYKAEKGSAFVFEVEAEVKPQFELSQYKGLSVEQEEIELLPGELDQAVDRIRERFAEVIEAPAGHALKDHDVANGPLRVLVDGNEVHKEDAQLLIMEGHVLGAYAHLGSKFLEGAKVGEKRTVDETLNEQFPVEAHRGKKATLEFEVKTIKTRKLPELNDELATKVGMKNAEDLKDKIRTSLLENVGNEIKRATRFSLLDKVVEGTKFELPQRLQDLMTQRTAHGNLQQFARYGVSPEALGMKMEDILARSKESAIAEMRRFFVIDAICAKEKIEISEDEIDAEIVKQARQNNMRAQEYYDRLLQEPDGLTQLTIEMKTQKALDFLLDNAEVKIVPRKPPEKKEDAAHAHPEHAPKAAGHSHDHSHDHGHDHGGHDHSHGGHSH